MTREHTELPAPSVDTTAAVPHGLFTLAFAFRSLIAAAAVLSVVDWLFATRWCGFHPGGFVIIFSTLTFLAVVVSPACAAVAWFSHRLNVQSPLGRRGLAILAGTVLTVPSYLFLAHAFAADLPLRWFSAAVAGLQLFFSIRARARDRYPLMGLVAAATTTWLILQANNSVGLHTRAGKGTFDPFLLGSALEGLIALAFSSALVRGFSTFLGARLSLARAFLYAALGLALTCAACLVPPGLYTTARWAIILAAYALVTTAISVWTPRIPLLVAVIVATSSAGTSFYLHQRLATTSTLVWNVTHATTVMRIVSRRTGLFSGRTRELLAELQRRPEASVGTDLAMPPRSRMPTPLPGPGMKSAVLVTIDALRFDHVGYSTKAPAGISPNLDRFADESVRFMNAYSQGPGTGWSVPSLLWSRYPPSIRFRRVLGTRERIYPAKKFPANEALFFASIDPMDEPAQNIQERFRETGIKSTVISHGFMGNLREDSGMVRGFGDVIVPATIDPALEDDWTADQAIRWLHRHASERFFLWIHLFSPHMDYRTHSEPSGFTGYANEVHFADQQLGRILRALDQVGRRTDTLVAICADHGESLGEGGRYAHSAQLYEELVHVPLLIRWPGLDPHRVDATVPLIHLAPTILQSMQVDPPSTMQGRDLFPYLRTPSTESGSPAFLYAWVPDMNSDRRKDIKAGVIEGRVKVVLDVSSGAMTCNDLATDPTEARNLLGEIHPPCLGTAGLLAGWFHAVTNPN